MLLKFLRSARRIFSPRRITRTGDDRPVKSLGAFVWRMSAWQQVGACLVAVLVTLLNLVPLELQRRIFDNGISASDTSLLFVLGSIYAGVVIGHQLTKLGLSIWQSWISESTVFYMRGHLSVLGGKGPQVDDEGKEDRSIVSILTTETEKLGGYVGTGPSQLVVNGSLLIGTIAYTVTISPMIALIGLACLMPQVLLAPVMQARLNRLVERRLLYMRKYAGALADGGEDDLSDLPKMLYRNRMAFFAWKFLMKSVLNLLNSAAIVSVIIVGGLLVIRGETTVGVVVAFVSGFSRLSDPIRALIGFYRETAQASVHHRLIGKWMNDRIDDGAGA